MTQFMRGNVRSIDVDDLLDYIDVNRNSEYVPTWVKKRHQSSERLDFLLENLILSVFLKFSAFSFLVVFLSLSLRSLSFSLAFL